MSDREENRRWLLRGAEVEPRGWEQRMITAFGVEGALDLLTLQGGDVHNVDFRHRPFVDNEELKTAVRQAREVVEHARRLAYEVWWEANYA